MTDFVGDYSSKRKLAEALRKSQERMLASANTMDMGTLKTAGMGGDGDGIYAQPGQEQVNWGAPIANIGMAFLNRGAEKKATEAEQAATDARMTALQQIAGGGFGANGTITPEQAVQLQELGIDGATMKMLMPKQASAGAVAQGYNSKSGIRGLLATGSISKEDADAGIAALDADEAAATQAAQDQYKFEQENKSHRPVTPRAETEMEWARRDPKGWSKFQRDKAKAAMEGKPAPVNPYEKKLQEEQAKADVKVMEGGPKLDLGIERVDRYIADHAKTPYNGMKYKAMDDAAKVVGVDVLPSSYIAEARKQQQDAKQFHLDAMEQMRGYGQVTESEQKIISDTQLDIYDTPEDRAYKLQTIRNALLSAQKKVADARARALAGGGVPGVTPGGGESVEELEAQLRALEQQ